MLLLSLRKQLQARHKKPPEDRTTFDAIMLSTVSAEKDTDTDGYRNCTSIRVLTWRRSNKAPIVHRESIVICALHLRVAPVDVVSEGALVLVLVLADGAEERDVGLDVALEKVAARARPGPEVALAEEAHETGRRRHNRVGEGGRRP